MGGDAAVTRHLSDALELLGLILIVAAAWVFDWRLGVAFLGALLVLVGWLLDRPGTAPRVVE